MKCKETEYRIIALSDRKHHNIDPEQENESTTKHNNDNEDQTLLSQSNDLASHHSDENNQLLFDINSQGGSGSTSIEWTHDQFHERLTVFSLQSIDDVEKYYSDNFFVLSGQCGVLLFLYTVLMTKVCMTTLYYNGQG